MKRHTTRIIALLIPLMIAVLIVVWAQSYTVPDRWEQYLEKVRVGNVDQMEKLFGSLNYHWPPSNGQTVPRIAIDPLPQDLGTQLDIERKKSLFFRAMLPMVLAENARIIAQRSKIISFLKNKLPAPTTTDGRWLKKLLHEYKIKGNISEELIRDQLLLRLDVIPIDLALAQAANESGWGASRFALEGNNLFGLWTYRKDMGIIPAARAEDQNHAVRAFPTARSSVRAYMHNINIGRAYRKFWNIRANMRASNQDLNSLQLAEGLLPYSGRGQDYIDEIRQLIISNRLDQLSGVELQAIDSL